MNVDDSIVLPGLTGRSVAVTGGASGIGRATALLAARSGASVVAGDLDEALLADLDDVARAESLPIRCQRLDVREPRSVTEFIAAADRDAPLHGVVNSAAIAVDRPALDISLEFWNDVLRVNLTGTFLVAQAAAQVIIGRGTTGSIVNLASTAGTTGRANAAPYSATKAAVISLTRVLAREWSPQGIRVNCVSPGAVDTPLRRRHTAQRDEVSKLPMGRVGTAEELAVNIGCFLSELTPWVTGQTLNVNGGSVAYL